MKKTSVWRRSAKRLFAVSALISLTILGFPAVAQAEGTGGGIGGGGISGPSLGSEFYWASTAYDNTTSAYADFLKRSGWSQTFTEQEIAKRVGNLNVCKTSNVIWWVHVGEANRWAYNYTGITNRWGWPDGGSIQNPAAKYGNRPASAAEYNAFLAWDAAVNGNKLNKQPGYVIICSGAFAKPDKTWTDTTTASKSSVTSETFTHPYSWTTEVKRQITVGGKDPIGADNLHNQTGAPVKSFFATDVWDKLNTTTGKGLTPAQLKTAVTTAVNKDANKPHATLTLDAANKAGMAEGGVLNFNEQTRLATVTSKETTTTKTTTTCKYTQKWDSKDGAYDPPTKTCSSSDAVTKASTATKTTGTLNNTGFWQMLAVHCNVDQFNALVAAGGSAYTVLNSGDSTKAISAVIRTQKVDKQPTSLEFGNAANTNAAKKATGTLAFYDKECPFICTPNASDPGATGSNGGTSNLNDGMKNGPSPVKDSLYGALLEGKNTNNIQLFRDNNPHLLTVDSWFPKSVNGVNYDGAAAISTTVTRWNQGTPDVIAGGNGNGGKFNMTTYGDGNKQLFTGSAGAAPNQRNWNVAGYSTTTSTLLPGFYNKFRVFGSWASDTNKPNVLNFKWEYKPSVTSTVLTNNMGFGVKSALNAGTATAVTTAVEGKCYASFGTQAGTSMIKSFGANTGTGTTNNLDSSLLEGAGNGGNAASLASNLVLNFVRATTE